MPLYFICEKNKSMKRISEDIDGQWAPGKNRVFILLKKSFYFFYHRRLRTYTIKLIIFSREKILDLLMGSAVVNQRPEHSLPEKYIFCALGLR